MATRRGISPRAWLIHHNCTVRRRTSADRAARTLVPACMKVWHKWLNRRSQRASKTWDEFNDLLQRYPLPRASVRVRLR
ncbi:MAG TPA: hypothetical protein VF493_01520 [Terriglobales bacterium]